MSHAEQGQARYYAKGDVIRFNRKYQSLGINQGEYVTVDEINAERQILMVRFATNKIKQLSFKKFKPGPGSIEVYWPKPMELKIGERLRFRRNEYTLEILNGMEVQLEAVHDDKVLLRKKEGAFSLPLAHPAFKHVDYAYTHTDFSVQGHDANKVVVLKEKNSPNHHLKSFNVDLTRAKYQITFITDNKAELVRHLETHLGEKSSAIEAVTLNEIMLYGRDSTENQMPLRVLNTKRTEWLTSHRATRLVSQFLNYHKEEKNVLRDRAAYELLQLDDKHYIDRVDVRLLKQAAHAHAGRLILLRASPEARKAFWRVREYKHKVKSIGTQYGQHFKNSKNVMLDPKVSAVIHYRNLLAYTIAKNLSLHAPALVHVGIINEAQLDRPQLKLQRLLQHAAWIEREHLLQQWQQTKNTVAKLECATALFENAKLISPSINYLISNSVVDGSKLDREQIILKRNEFFASLNDTEKFHFKTVEQYLQAKKAASIAWRNVYQAKAEVTRDPAHLQQFLLPLAKAFTQVRDAFALPIIKKPENYQRGLAYFKVDETLFKTVLNQANKQQPPLADTQHLWRSISELHAFTAQVSFNSKAHVSTIALINPVMDWLAASGPNRHHLKLFNQQQEVHISRLINAGHSGSWLHQTVTCLNHFETIAEQLVNTVMEEKKSSILDEIAQQKINRPV